MADPVNFIYRSCAYQMHIFIRTIDLIGLLDVQLKIFLELLGKLYNGTFLKT